MRALLILVAAVLALGLLYWLLHAVPIFTLGEPIEGSERTQESGSVGSDQSD